ncbi:hypothetical protein QEH59_10165 [Coraliomargarita sp. SDUM461004]|uniref:ROK family transcriptional regulator n=1 Tax=Thalassobacterium sedimentorum TaxID=3041258 RepID=A0ABU1AJ34_9BACT|nr:hypothetical protein [Coraliomargarita sp. SDUM461004]MDQ8194791.1 hypothetical protein [Coraliomargarita sp. SDUM461004]
MAETSKARNSLSLERFVRLVLLNKEVTRSKIAEQTGFSPASITQKSKWLDKHGLIRKVTVRKKHSKRPVEALSLSCLPWVTLAVHIRASDVTVQVINSTSEQLALFHQKVSRPTQRSVFTAIGKSVTKAQGWIQSKDQRLTGIGLEVDGIVSDNNAALIYSLNGIDEWLPCSPKFMHPQLIDITVIGQWTQVASKLHGLAKQLGTDNNIAYVERYKRDLHLAVMHNGIIKLGRMGTSGPFLHQSVRKSGGQCYCGNTSCLDALLRAGKASDEMLFTALDAQIHKHGIKNLGLERIHKQSHFTYENKQLTTLVFPKDGEQLNRDGSALLVTEAMLLNHMHDLNS